ncbi:MAG: PQQ-dependent sugar dehydrogenase [Myxococcota bacterium]
MVQSRTRLLPAAAATVMGVGLGTALALQLPQDWFGAAAPPPEPYQPTIGPLTPTFEGPDQERTKVDVRLVPIVAGIGQPTDLAFVPGHPDRMVVTSKWGTLHLVDFESGLREYWMWLDVLDALECGVLGFAFHPAFESNGRFFVNHCPMREEDEFVTVVTEHHVNPKSLRNPKRIGDVISVRQPAGTHNGGQIAFGPDGMLYVGLGDGCAGGDPFKNGQDLKTLLGSMLRLDVSTPGSYTIPPDNPFASSPTTTRPEIWAYGLRNPWRFTFDPLGRLVVADVGQSAWEEINVVERGDNLGWRIREGFACHDPPEGCANEGFVDPVFTYGRYDGASLTGGVVTEAPGPLQDHYVFADFVTGRFWALRLPDARRPVDAPIALGQFDVSPTAFTHDPQGRVWVADFRSEIIFRIEPVASP